MSEPAVLEFCKRVSAPEIDYAWQTLGLVATIGAVLFVTLWRTRPSPARLVCVNATFEQQAVVREALREHLVPYVDVWAPMNALLDRPFDASRLANFRATLELIEEFAARSYEELTALQETNHGKVFVLLGSLSQLQCMVGVLAAHARIQSSDPDVLAHTLQALRRLTDPVYLNAASAALPPDDVAPETLRQALDQAVRPLATNTDFSQGAVVRLSTDSKQAFWTSLCEALEARKSARIF